MRLYNAGRARAANAFSWGIDEVALAVCGRGRGVRAVSRCFSWVDLRLERDHDRAAARTRRAPSER